MIKLTKEQIAVIANEYVAARKDEKSDGNVLLDALETLMSQEEFDLVINKANSITNG